MGQHKASLAIALASTLTAPVFAIGAAAPAMADDAAYMNRQQLEQAVLRAQPGGQLGRWTQNFYFDDVFGPADLRPEVCPAGPDATFTLPKADSRGSVGYEAPGQVSMSISIWQYKRASDAAAAATRWSDVVCSDSPKVSWEEPGKLYQAEGGSDLTETIVGGNRGYVGGYQFTADDAEVSVQYGVRVVGRSVVRVEVVLVNDVSSKRFSSANRLLKSWLDRSSRAVLKFSSVDPNAA